MLRPSHRKVLFVVALFGLSLPAHSARAANSPRQPRTRSRPAAHESRAVTNPWRELLALFGLDSQGPPPKLPQAGCEVDPDGKCRIPTNPPTP
jgi:hypothetical protein